MNKAKTAFGAPKAMTTNTNKSLNTFWCTKSNDQLKRTTNMTDLK
jgi:hypothetical protein